MYLEKSFDEVNQGRLMWLLSILTEDNSLLDLISKTQKSGIHSDTVENQRIEGTSQASP